MVTAPLKQWRGRWDRIVDIWLVSFHGADNVQDKNGRPSRASRKPLWILKLFLLPRDEQVEATTTTACTPMHVCKLFRKAWAFITINGLLPWTENVEIQVSLVWLDEVLGLDAGGSI
ncbi:hypothetical protein GOP47_0006453 [Adiantum capillus-veneris]|uniref:Uncharacterized protein n=1 Tax=Adiantum capillus-veneris TaxID=13818 RepID=A0A9D4V3Q0_ADICA|nr:hypothetical protein GOP47_0006453 [Adiantum capillus-veneris]